MKHTDGLFHRGFKEVAQEYPDIEADNWIIDIIKTENLYEFDGERGYSPGQGQ